jgi:hypothetical protein
MNTETIIPRFAVQSPNVTARLAATFLLITMLTGAIAQALIAGRLVVPGDASTTAANIVAHQSLFRFGFAVYLLELACQITMTVLFYGLLKPVSRPASLLAAAFGLTGCIVKILSRLFFFAPLLVLGGSPSLSVFDPKQLQALAFLFLRVDYTAETIAMVFFGWSAIVNGYLMFTSTFLPRVLGVLSAIGGLGWLIYLDEPLARRLQSYIVGAAFFGALATVLWLLVKGVDERRWKELAGAGAGRMGR